MTQTLTTQDQLKGNWSADPVHSSVGFSVRYMGLSNFSSSFKEVYANLSVTEEGITLEGRAPVQSLDVSQEQFRGHLLSEEFFNEKDAPEITFSSTELNFDEQTVTGTGELSIRGIKQPVDIAGTIEGPIEDPYGNTRVGFNLSTVVDRTQFGMNWNMPLPNGKPSLANEVNIAVQLYLVKGQ